MTKTIGFLKFYETGNPEKSKVLFDFSGFCDNLGYTV